ncbi:MAG: hypothetical protein ACK4F9_04705 [Brevinematia bacterium]
MKKYFFVIVFFILLNVCYGEVNFLDPMNVVSNAMEYLIRRDFSNLLSVTELAEKRRVEKTLNAYYGSDKLYIDKEIGNLESFRVLDIYYEEDFAVVSVEWFLKNSHQAKEGVKTYTANRRFLYLLKKFGDMWKIITKKVEM